MRHVKLYFPSGDATKPCYRSPSENCKGPKRGIKMFKSIGTITTEMLIVPQNIYSSNCLSSACVSLSPVFLPIIGYMYDNVYRRRSISRTLMHAFSHMFSP